MRMEGLSLRREANSIFTYGLQPYSEDHGLVLFFGCIYIFLAVECDIPYKNSQVSEYGQTFAPWSNDDIGQMIGSLSAGLQLNSIAVVVH